MNTIRKTKQLHSITIDHITISTRCWYNLNTHSIKIYNQFYESSSYNGGTITNKECASWLGDKTETILMSMFDKVKRMPVNNPGYDFLCGKGYKIDCKSGCFKKHHPNQWRFTINYNTTANFFLCLALDNRTDFNPLHVWLIPGEDINHKSDIMISESTIDKWSEYEQPIDKVISCCNNIKDNNL